MPTAPAPPTTSTDPPHTQSPGESRGIDECPAGTETRGPNSHHGARHPLGSACGALFTLLDLTTATPSKERSSRVNPLPRKAGDSVRGAGTACETAIAHPYAIPRREHAPNAIPRREPGDRRASRQGPSRGGPTVAATRREAPPRLGLRHSPVPRKAGDCVRERPPRAPTPPRLGLRRSPLPCQAGDSVRGAGTACETARPRPKRNPPARAHPHTQSPGESRGIDERPARDRVEGAQQSEDPRRPEPPRLGLRRFVHPARPDGCHAEQGKVKQGESGPPQSGRQRGEGVRYPQATP